jgi:hypothetical protein
MYTDQGIQNSSSLTFIINYFPEHFYLLGYNAEYLVESQLTFRRTISSPTSGSKNKPGKKPT